MKRLPRLRRWLGLLLCRHVRHVGPLIDGGGMWDDLVRCEYCGREKYEEHWTLRERRRARRTTDARQAAEHPPG